MEQAKTVEPGVSESTRAGSRSLLISAGIPTVVAAFGVLVTRRFDVVTWGVDGFLFMFMPAVIVILAQRQNPLDFGLRVGNWRWGLFFTVGGILLSILVVRVSVAIFPSITEYYGDKSITPGVFADVLLYMFSWEFLMRGYVFHSFKRDFGLARGNIGQSAIFSLAHFGKPFIEVVTTPVSGLVFGIVTHRSMSVLPMVAIHTTIQLSAY